LVTFTPLPDDQPDVPAPAAAARPPAEIVSNEELFLNGLHLEQYRHATYDPEPYYQEALRRDPHDSRCNHALGLLRLRRGKFVEAEGYFRTAIARLTLRNPNPYDGESYYSLGLALRWQGRYAEAFDAFYKAIWNAAWQAAGYFELARLACRAGRLDKALELADRALVAHGHHHRARHLKIAVLRHLGRTEDALTETARAQQLDPLDFGSAYERFLLAGETSWRDLMRGYVHNFVEIALDYAHAGLFPDAIWLIDDAPRSDPMVEYYLGWFHLQAGDVETADRHFRAAATLPPDYCFPHRLEAVPALKAAIARQPDDARAPYYLGNFWYAHRQYEDAIACWESARNLDPTFATVHRNLGLAYMNKRHDPDRALASYERAFELDRTDARVFYELDQLHKRMGESPQDRLARLEQNLALVDRRDDLTLERVTLLNLLGRHAKALDVLMTRNFHPWEGGEGKVTGQYVIGLVESAKTSLYGGDYRAAVDFLERAQVYPHNLGEGKLAGVQENHIFYYLAQAYEGMGQAGDARRFDERASVGLSEPTSPLYYNDQPPDMIFYQGLARQKLGQSDVARSIFQKLIDYGEAHLNDSVMMDYFAVSLPDFLVFDDDLTQRNRVHCRYMIALGHLGLGNTAEAAQRFAAILEQVPHHVGAAIHQKLLMQTLAGGRL
jgi:tetratricopeptide (TPR) repeat protein